MSTRSLLLPWRQKSENLYTVIFNLIVKETSNLVYSTKISKIRTNSINIKEIGKEIETRLYAIAPKKNLIVF